MLAVIIFSTYFISHWIILALITNKLKENDLALLSPVLELVLLPLGSIIYLSNMIVKQERWK
jgi:hypothetical protein